MELVLLLRSYKLKHSLIRLLRGKADNGMPICLGVDIIRPKSEVVFPDNYNCFHYTPFD